MEKKLSTLTINLQCWNLAYQQHWQDKESRFMPHSEQTQRIRRFFNAVAPVYDLLVLPVMQSRIQKAVALLGDVSNLAVLDVCTGTGIMAVELAKRGARVTGVDFSPAMLARAARKAKGLPLTFHLMDATRLEFEDNFFDICVICMALHEMPRLQRERALAEMRRVTRHRVLLMDWASLPANRFWRLGVPLVERLEGSYYKEFMRSNLSAVISKYGLKPLVYEVDSEMGIFLCLAMKI
ncbi:class I SAM-dependent methyltransferase [Desulfurispora thermophila]|uniref:class I SAM-dependent methyltransferase n=1 Tax=Desulfurispora thermophila TaxID=265470 RepID=UPI00036BAB9C|nr:class I SAM-dependent methyltransferase [Desulfurispora thermophila]